MLQGDRLRFDRALRRARPSAYGDGEFVGQESFMRAGEILALARRAGIGPGVSVLDLCCGVAGPGRLVTRELGCDYVGVDASTSALAIAADRAGDLDCEFVVGQVPPVPSGPFDVVLLLETLLAFADKEVLLKEVAGVLGDGGRFAFTMEEGDPLTEAERQRMPDADTVWLVPRDDLVALLERVGLRVRWEQDCSRSHLEVAEAMTRALVDDAAYIAAHVGQRALDDLLDAHRLWTDWLRVGRVRKLAFVAEKLPDSGTGPGYGATALMDDVARAGGGPR